MSKLLHALMAILCLGAAAVHADNFWEKTKFPDWSEKEVRKMLNNSPWAHAVDIRLSILGSRSTGRRRGGGTGGLGGEQATGAGAGIPGRGGSAVPETAPVITVHVRWRSALPVRQAMAKSQFGDEVMSSPEAAKLLSHLEKIYVVEVAGVPLRALQGTPDTLKSNAFLKIKGKPLIHATDIRGEREQDGVNLYLIFPRGQDATHQISLEDKEVEFVIDLGPTTVKRKFKLREMVYEGKLEL